MFQSSFEEWIYRPAAVQYILRRQMNQIMINNEELLTKPKLDCVEVYFSIFSPGPSSHDTMQHYADQR